MNVLIAAYAVVVGLFMLGFWGFLVLTKQAELDARPWDMRLHLAAEFVTALLLIGSGAAGMLGVTAVASLAPVALGMLLYSVVNSPGFYAGKGNWPMVGMFAALAILTMAALLALFVFGLA